MNLINTSPEALLDVFRSNCEKAWKEFIETNGFGETDPAVMEGSKHLFTLGYQSGANFTSHIFTEALKKVLDNKPTQ